jgi:predicted DNA-binding ribbon-helix-helix protein
MSPIIKRSVIIGGHKTSVSLEDRFWNALKEIASGREVTLSELVGAIDKERQHGNLSSAIRLFVLGFYRDQIATHEGEMRSPGQTVGANGHLASLFVGV